MALSLYPMFFFAAVLFLVLAVSWARTICFLSVKCSDDVLPHPTSLQLSLYHPSLQIRLASIQSDADETLTSGPEDHQGSKFSVTRGDYSPLLAMVVEELKEAK